MSAPPDDIVEFAARMYLRHHIQVGVYVRDVVPLGCEDAAALLRRIESAA